MWENFVVECVYERVSKLHTNILVMIPANLHTYILRTVCRVALGLDGRCENDGGLLAGLTVCATDTSP